MKPLKFFDSSDITHHYLKNQLASKELISLSSNYSVLIKNPFLNTKDNPEDVAFSLNQFLYDNAAFIAASMGRGREGGTVTVYGSHSLSRTSQKLILTKPTGKTPKVITSLGFIGEQLKSAAPDRVKAFITPIEVFTMRKKTIGSIKSDHHILNDHDLKASVYFPTPGEHIQFLMSIHEKVDMSKYLSKEDIKALCGGVDLRSPMEIHSYFVDIIKEDLPPKFSGQLLKADLRDDSILKLANLFYKLRINEFSKRPQYDIYWKGKVAGNISSPQPNKWYVTEDKGWILPFHISNTGDIPAFFENLLPETDVIESNRLAGFLEDERDLMGDISIRKKNSIKPPNTSYLREKLMDNLDNNSVFTGELKNIGILNGDHAQKAELLEETEQVRMSGFASKIPVLLSKLNNKATIQPCLSGESFTHIFKIPNNEKLAKLQLCEWFGMSIARESGVTVPSFGLVINNGSNLSKSTDPIPLNIESLSKQMFNFSSILDTYPNYLIERFDLSHEGDNLLSVGEDFASIMNVVSSTKYDLEMDSIAKILKELSSDWEGDREVLLRHLIVNILVGNNDLHAKNISLLKTYDSETKEMVNCKLSPAYDIVCMEPSLLGLKNLNSTHGMYLHGKRDFGLETLMQFAKSSLEFTEEEANIIIGDACSKALKFASKLGEDIPNVIKTSHPSSVTNIRIMCNFVHQNYSTYFGKNITLSDILDDEITKNSEKITHSIMIDLF
jgi:hypothetical protein